MASTSLHARIAVSAAVIAAALAAAVPARAATQRAVATPARGNFAGAVDIGQGRTLFMRCKGTGSPAVILESGIHDSSDTWTLTQTDPPVVPSPAVFGGVARATRGCMYDRPGTIRYTDPPTITMRSTPVPMPRTLTAMADDLHALLVASSIRGPYVLVGHSFGGMIVRLFAQTHRSEVAGIVFVDAFGTNVRSLFGRSLWPTYARLLNQPGIALQSDPGFETVDIDGAIDAVLHAPALPRVPLAVMSKTEPFGTAPGVSTALKHRLEAIWPRVQDRLVSLEPQTPHILATGSDHYVQIRDPDLTTATVRLILDRARHAR